MLNREDLPQSLPDRKYLITLLEMTAFKLQARARLAERLRHWIAEAPNLRRKYPFTYCQMEAIKRWMDKEGLVE